MNKSQQVCIFIGARPNFVKVAPIIRVINKTDGIDYQLVYAGCENDPTLEPSLFDDLQMPRPNVFLGVDCENLNELTGRVMSEFEQYLEQHPTDTVIVVDDLASTMAAAIVTKKRGLRLAHLVAGTRSFDMTCCLLPVSVPIVLPRVKVPRCTKYSWWAIFSWTHCASTTTAGFAPSVLTVSRMGAISC